ncbi:Lipid A biosynthesis lauroyl acyltransferase [uncultured Paludibacter sp.]|nr:Lipid A biosynthesis lauroyl acyltransferase [uncultured Paludibacter sp.]
MFQINRHKLNNFRRKTVITSLYPLLIFLILLFRILPIKAVRKFASFIGEKFYRFAKKNRETALANIKKVYGESLTEEEQIALAKHAFIESLMGFNDYLAFSHVKEYKQFFKLIEVKGEEHLENAYKRGKGVICLIPHLSSWEFAAITPPMLGYETSAASKAIKSNLLEKLMIKFRSRRGMKNITREGSYAALVEVLKKGECLILMTDQDTKVKGIFVDFLGFPAYTPLGASRLLAETDAALVPMAMTRKENGNYRFIIYPEIPTVKTENPQNDLIVNTQNQNKILSEIIRTYPSQWVWMHRRWKTTPEALEKFLKRRKEEKERS